MCIILVLLLTLVGQDFHECDCAIKIKKDIVSLIIKNLGTFNFSTWKNTDYFEIYDFFIKTAKTSKIFITHIIPLLITKSYISVIELLFDNTNGFVVNWEHEEIKRFIVAEQQGLIVKIWQKKYYKFLIKIGAPFDEEFIDIVYKTK